MLDKEALLNFYNGDAESISMILHQVKDNIGIVIHDIEQATDVAALNHMLHYHGPSFTYAGLSSITQVMKQLEEKTKIISELSAIETEVKAIIVQLQQSETSLQQYLEELNTLSP